jgi:hypothetical protein
MSGGPGKIDVSPYELVNAQIANEQWNHYQNAIVPVENRYMKEVARMNTPGQFAKAADMAQSEVMRQYAPMLRDTSKNTLAAGAGPNSGRYLMQQAALRGAGAEAVGTAGFGAKQAQKDRYVSGLENILGMGNGQATMAQEGMADVAAQQVDRARQNAFAQWDAQNALGTAAGMAVGMGVRPWVDKAYTDYMKE